MLEAAAVVPLLTRMHGEAGFAVQVTGATRLRQLDASCGRLVK